MSWIEGVRNAPWLPLLLVGLLPLLLHWLDRKRARVVVWPAMRFLVDRNSRRARRWERREMLLLLTRSLLAVAIAAAILRPYSSRAAVARPLAAVPRAMALVLDVSYSMAYRGEEGGPSALERAREAAMTALDEAAPGSRATVVLAPQTGGSGAGPGTARAGTVESARRGVRDAQLAGGAFDLAAAIEHGASALAGDPGLPASVVVFTDLQASTLEGLDATRLAQVARRLSTLPSRPQVLLVDCGEVEPKNRGITAFTAEPLAPVVGLPVPFTCAVELSPSGAAFPPTPLRVEEAGGALETTLLEPAPGGSAQALLRLKLSQPGAARVVAEIARDGLSEDDSRSLVLELEGKIPVVIVGGVQRAEARRARELVDLALRPRAQGVAAPAPIFEVANSGDAAATSLSRARVAVLVSGDGLDDEAAARLERFVRAGGGLVGFLDGSVETSRLAAALFRQGRGMLPGGLARQGSVEPDRRGDPLHPRVLTPTHPALAVFSGGDEGDLARVTIRSLRQMETLAPDAKVLATAGEHDPWLVERSAGAGKTVLFTTSASGEDSDLPHTPLFLPLLHNLVRHVAARPESERNVLVGEPCRIRIPAAAKRPAVEVLDPTGAKATAHWIENEGFLVAEGPPTAVPGIHTVTLDLDGAVTTELVAANLDPRETRLGRASPAALEATLKTLGARVSRRVDVDLEQVQGAREEVELWRLLLLAAVGLFFLEGFLARGLSRGATQPLKQGKAT